MYKFYIYDAFLCTKTHNKPFYFIQNNFPYKIKMRDSWIKIIRGMPITNFGCLVLCRYFCIPNQHPMLPPNNAIRKKRRSGTRHCSFLAFSLSQAIMINPIRLIKKIYNNIAPFKIHSTPHKKIEDIS